MSVLALVSPETRAAFERKAAVHGLDMAFIESASELTALAHEEKSFSVAILPATLPDARIKIMMYSASRSDVKNIVQWLQGHDESQWKDQTSLLSETISDLNRMARPKRRPDKTGSRSMEPDSIPHGAAEINTAMPQLKNMMSAMRSRNRAAAIESGEAALAFLHKGP
jgi:hypothetical protein